SRAGFSLRPLVTRATLPPRLVASPCPVVGREATPVSTSTSCRKRSRGRSFHRNSHPRIALSLPINGGGYALYRNCLICCCCGGFLHRSRETIWRPFQFPPFKTNWPIFATSRERSRRPPASSATVNPPY